MNHAQGAPTIGSSMNIAALNIGNAIGTWLCGIPMGSGGARWCRGDGATAFRTV
ncbi:MAG: hypothetical protein SOI66_04575 [Bifidobacterium sp.]